MIARDIATDIDSFIHQCGGANEDWYIGVAFDAEYTLFNQHKVSRNFDSWIYRVADTSEIARHVEKAYLEAGYDGRYKAIESAGNIIYAYLKSSHTEP